MQKIISSLFLLFLSFALFAQTERTDYIEKYKSIAVKKMKEHGIPASITLAQGILESRAGNSTLATKAKNHFGIKCHNDWNGRTFKMDDDKKNECFRKYRSADQSFEDHSQFLTLRDRYAFLFEYKVTDYKNWAHGLKKAGYATNPQYAHMLIKIIEDYNLDRFDKMKRIKKPKVENIIIAQSENHSKYPEYQDNKADDFKPISVSATNRVIYEAYKVQYVLALQHDSWKTIAKEFGFYTRQILNFNSAKRKTVLNPGDKVYIEKKNRKADVRYHIVQQGETLQSISQIYAVRTAWIKRHNKIKRKDDLIAGQRLILR
ncbi:MAG: glucosaminidase domain-containing protein [Bacteroidales bacterium]|jgi:LysM repeat protein|nr:glucosaminidase domain-containing protein [Bacteroidales bacterium]